MSDDQEVKVLTPEVVGPPAVRYTRPGRAGKPLVIREKGGPGRPKGSKNKIPAQVKHALALAAEKLGGWQRLVRWVNEDPKNEFAFWVYIYPRLLGHEQVQVPQLPANITVVITKAPDSDASE